MARWRWSGEERRREALDAFRSSGLSLRRFAARSGVPYSTLCRWRRAEGPRLVSVEVAPAEAAALEVSVGAATVRVPAGFDEAHLVRVVQALRSC